MSEMITQHKEIAEATAAAIRELLGAAHVEQTGKVSTNAVLLAVKDDPIALEKLGNLLNTPDAYVSANQVYIKLFVD